jgi:hypothetical protein
MPNPWSHEHDEDRARERSRLEDEGRPDAAADAAAKDRLREAGEVRGRPQPPNARAYGPKGER